MWIHTDKCNNTEQVDSHNKPLVLKLHDNPTHNC